MERIIFIQGIHNFRLRNYSLFKLLKSMGHEVVHFPMFYSVNQTEKHKDLIDRLNTFLDDNQYRYSLLGHSFGGIIAYSLKEEHYSKIDRIITVASPHQVRFKWFKRIVDRLPYVQQEIIVKDQRSYGFFFDTTVPFIFTGRRRGVVHKNLIGTHNLILNSPSLIKKIL